MIKLSAVACVLAYLTCLAVSEKRADPPENIDNVVVIGAGLGGLSAAVELQRQGKNVIVIEAQNSPGGRSRTLPDRHPGGMEKHELGGQWIVGSRSGNPLMDMCTKYGLETKVIGESEAIMDRHYWHDGSRLSDREMDDSWYYFDCVIEEMYNDAWYRYPDDIPLCESYYRAVASLEGGKGGISQKMLDIVQFHAEGEFGLDIGAEICDVSLMGYMFGSYYMYPGPDSVVVGGVRLMSEGLVNELEELGGEYRNFERGTLVDWSGDGVVVTTMDYQEQPHTYSADAVVVAVPMGALKGTSATQKEELTSGSQGSCHGGGGLFYPPLEVANKVNFQPALPNRKQNAINTFKMGMYNRLLVEFTEGLWPTDFYSWGFISDNSTDKTETVGNLRDRNLTALANAVEQDTLRMRTLHNTMFAERPGYVLSGEVSSFYGRDFENSSDEDLAAILIDIAKVCFDMEPHPNDPTVITTSRWVQDKATGGSYSFPIYGGNFWDRGENFYDIMAEPVDNKIFWSGEGTIWNQWGMMYGAVNAGFRAAGQITGDFTKFDKYMASATVRNSKANITRARIQQRRKAYAAARKA